PVRNSRASGLVVLRRVPLDRFRARKSTAGLPGSSGGPFGGRLVPRPELLEAGRCLDESAVHGDVLVDEQPEPVRLGRYLVEEPLGDRGAAAARSLRTEDRLISSDALS